MEDGLDLDCTLRLVRNLNSNNKNQFSYNFKAALETVLVARCWPASRIAECSSDYPTTCPRCGDPFEDALHAFWTCPHNNLIECEHVQSTQGLINRASTEASSLPCLWLRGLLPSKFSNIDICYTPTNQLIITNHHGALNSCSWTSGTYYGDASGGEYTSYKALRRMGVGLAKCSGSVFHFGISSNLPGPVQTVARGETFALSL